MIDIIGSPSSNSKAVHYAFQNLGIESRIIGEPQDLLNSRKIVLPGVGAFGSLANYLTEKKFREPLKNCLLDGAKMLGICLGMQMLALDSEESIDFQGLGVFELHCVKFKGDKLRVPHTGWNQTSVNIEHQIVNGLTYDFSAFYSHSYYVPFHSKYSVASTHYENRFSSVIAKNNIVGVQFHPERSQASGRKILTNFADW